MLTNYKIVYEINRSVKMVIINAATPMQALKEFKKMMPQLVYKNLSLHEVEREVKQVPCRPCKMKMVI